MSLLLYCLDYEIRRVTMDEVKFDIRIEPETMSIQGNFVFSDCPSDDRRAEYDLQCRVERGETYAWCTLVVVARWSIFEGSDSLSCCSFHSTNDLHRTIEEHAESHAMKEGAIANLNTTIAHHLRQTEDLIKKLKVEKQGTSATKNDYWKET